MNDRKDIGAIVTFDGTPVSMDSMLTAAMKLGSVSLSQDSWAKGALFTAEIVIKLGSGSRVHAKGHNSDPWLAMADALSEAAKLGRQYGEC
jgi:ribosome-associated translation inhibitor RaiA